MLPLCYGVRRKVTVSIGARFQWRDVSLFRPVAYEAGDLGPTVPDQGLDGRNSIPGGGKRSYLFYSTHPPLRWISCVVYSGPKRPENEAYHSPRSSADV
jgi:hypothetical protein